MTPLVTFGDGWRYFWRIASNSCSVWAAFGFMVALKVFLAICEMLWAAVKGVTR